MKQKELCELQLKSEALRIAWVVSDLEVYIIHQWEAGDVAVDLGRG